MSMNVDIATVWQQSLDDLRHDTSLKAADIKTWLEPLRIDLQGEDTIRLEAINDIFVGKIKKEYLGKIEQVVKARSHGKIDKIIIEAFKYDQSVQFGDDKSVNINTQKKHKEIQDSTEITGSDPLQSDYTFDNFVKGKSNSLAYNVSLDLAKKGTQSVYRSLFIYGSSGFGKTHLMQAVAHRYQRAGRKFCYFKHENFVRKVVNASRMNQVEDFIKQVCQADLLIIDDIHFLNASEKPFTADILLRLYDEFNQEGRSIILASDKAPMMLTGFGQRFLSRFASGMTVMIEPPEIDTRVQILEKRASILKMHLPKDCALFIAQNMPADVRQLIGALNQVYANQELQQSQVDIHLVKFALKDKIVARTQSLNAENIKAVVAEYYGLSPKDLVGKKRTRNIARPRQMAMALVRELTNKSYPDIGQDFGGRDHSTVMYACEKVEELKQTDPITDKDYMALMATLGVM